MTTPTLLLALEVLAAESGLIGLGPSRIAIGVRSDADHWWLAELGQSARTALVDERPVGCDFQLLVGEAEAEAIVAGRLPDDPQLLEARGDPTVMKALVERLRPKSWLDVRSGKSR